jgi:putative ABC transport system permease protein
MVRALFVFVASLMGVIVLFTVSNTMSMAIMERTEEIGTLRAMGTQRKGIRWLFIAEGMLLGVAGWVTGVALALFAAWVLERCEIPWSPPGMAIDISVTARFWNEPLLIGLTGSGIVLVSIISAWLPARRAAHMNIVDALRHV